MRAERQAEKDEYLFPECSVRCWEGMEEGGRLVRGERELTAAMLEKEVGEGIK
jgi:hypothetical protein